MHALTSGKNYLLLLESILLLKEKNVLIVYGPAIHFLWGKIGKSAKQVGLKSCNLRK